MDERCARRIEGHEPALGEAVLVADSQKVYVGWGVYNPISMYRVRCPQRLPPAFEAGDTRSFVDATMLPQQKLSGSCRVCEFYLYVVV